MIPTGHIDSRRHKSNLTEGVFQPIAMKNTLRACSGSTHDLFPPCKHRREGEALPSSEERAEKATQMCGARERTLWLYGLQLFPRSCLAQRSLAKPQYESYSSRGKALVPAKGVPGKKACTAVPRTKAAQLTCIPGTRC